MPMTKVLFVCSGNIFRSLSAERALRSVLQPQRDSLGKHGDRFRSTDQERNCQKARARRTDLADAAETFQRVVYSTPCVATRRD